MRTIIFLLLVTLFSLSCDLGTPSEVPTSTSGTGSIAFSLSRVSVPPEIKLLVVRLEQQGFQTIFKSIPVGGTSDTMNIHMADIPIGIWNVTVDAQDAQGVTRYSGRGSVAVVDAQLSQLYVYMTPLVGGEVQITVIWGSPRFRWKMSAENPVLSQTLGSWDQKHYYHDDPALLKIGGVYHIWYSTGYNLSVSKVDTLWIAHASSLDGIHWTKTGPVFEPGASGSWRDKGAISPCVLFDGGIYKMWFVGSKNPFQYQNGIGYATSQDGVKWSVEPQPVLPLTSSIGATWHPSVVKKDNVYYLFVGVSASSSIYSGDVVLLTSLDGRSWQNRGVVFSAHGDLPWQRSGILPSEVIYDENRFKMFFTAMNVQSFSIGYAESADGVTWTGSGEPPILTSASTAPWPTASVGFPAVLRDGGKLKMWFSAIVMDPPRYQIGYAEQVQ
ncbi:MAG: hypothetical protein NTZ35_00035 [Ignavibacteriales bacterium]|nr:hypothetical protein [Ignavibacteriales bacterium]